MTDSEEGGDVIYIFGEYNLFSWINQVQTVYIVTVDLIFTMVNL